MHIIFAKKEAFGNGGKRRQKWCIARSRQAHCCKRSPWSCSQRFEPECSLSISAQVFTVSLWNHFFFNTRAIGKLMFDFHCSKLILRERNAYICWFHIKLAFLLSLLISQLFCVFFLLFLAVKSLFCRI